MKNISLERLEVNILVLVESVSKLDWVESPDEIPDSLKQTMMILEDRTTICKV